MSLYKAYLEGKHKEVWDELSAADAEVLENAFLARDAMLVARETMLRVRENIETIVSRLRKAEYRFATESLSDLFGSSMANPCRVYAPPEAQVHQLIKELENCVGTIPIAVRSWFEIVGSVNLMGTHRTLSPPSGALSDPLVIMSPREILSELADRSVKPTLLPLFPSAQSKAGIAEGSIYSVRLGRSVDAQLNVEPLESFIGYLRRSMQWGGFPGLSKNPPPDLESIRVGLLKF